VAEVRSSRRVPLKPRAAVILITLPST